MASALLTMRVKHVRLRYQGRGKPTMATTCTRAPGDCTGITDACGHWHEVYGHAVFGDRYAVAVDDNDEIIVDRRPNHMRDYW